MSTLVRVEGFVAPGYELVAEKFLQAFKDGIEENAQLCANVRGKVVVDMWGTSIGDSSYNGDRLHAIHSNTKIVTAIVMNCMVDQGHLRYDERVAHYLAGVCKEREGPDYN